MSVASGDNMSEQQIQQILKRLDEQDKVFQSIRNDIANLKDEIRPLNEVFHNVSGFGSITVSILKTLALLGTAIGVVYAFIFWLRH